MRNTLTFFILGLACLLRAQQFNGYGTVSIITANPGSPFHEIVINGFVGGLQPGGAESYQPASIAVGDAVWLHCARFTVTATGNITPLYLEIVPDDINQPEPVEHEVAFICRETVAATGGVAAAPPVAVGAGGLPTDLAQCVTAYYAQAATTGAGEGLRKTAQRFAWGNAPGDTTRSIVTNRKLISQSPSGAGTVICPNDNGAFRVSAYPSPASLPLTGDGDYSFSAGSDIEMNKDYFFLQVHDGNNAIVVNDSVSYFSKRIEYSEDVVLTAETLVPKDYVDALDAADGDKSATNENQTVSAGTGISVVQTGQNFTVTNTGDTNAADDLTISSTAGGDLTGTFSNLQIAANAVGTAEIANGSVASADMTSTVTPGSCTNCNVTFDAAGRATTFSNGSGGDGSGTVTSVDLSLPTDVFDVGGNPITTNGTFSVTFDAQTAKKFLASPTSATGTPTMRVIVADDLPTIPGSKISGDITGNAGSLTTGNKGDITSSSGVLAINANVIGTNQLADAGVETADIADEAVITPKIAGGAVTGDKIADMAATDGQVLKWTTASGWAPGDIVVGSAEVTDNSLTSDDIADGSIQPDDISDMGASAGQVLKWNGTYWEPSADNTGSTAPGGSSGQVQVNNSGGFGGEATLFWDFTNDRLGVGTNSPQKTLHVISSAENQGLAIGENNGLNLMILGYDNGTNRGSIQSYNNGTASNLNINPIGGNLGIGLGTTAPGYRMDVRGICRFATSATVFTPYTLASMAFQRADSYNYTETRNNNSRQLFGGNNTTALGLYGEGNGGMDVQLSTTVGGTFYPRFFVPNGTGGLATQYVGGTSAGANSVAAKIAGVVFSATADGSVSNTTIETTVLGTVAGTKTLPTNFFSTSGSTARITVCGTITNTATPTLDLKLKYGSTVIASTGATTLATITGTGNFTATFLVTCRTAGASGSVVTSGTLTYFSTAATPNMVQFANQTTTINTTTSNAIDLTATWGAADVSNVIVGTISTVEIIY
ncbi:MAG: beta strand repeat-containing protein [Saprospiraceae bacterium]